MNNLALAQQYLQWGIAPLPLPCKSKTPTLPNWQNLRLTFEQLPDYFNGSPSNIGGLMGSASNSIIDIDLDWPEAAQLAPHLLPNSWQFGRQGLLRHVLIKAPGIKTSRFDAPASVNHPEGRRILEILADGAQVVLPGSLHPSGQAVEWLTAPASVSPAELSADELLSRIQALAGAALIVHLWPSLEGTRHDVALALAGALKHAQWPIKRIETLLMAVLKTVEDDEKKDRFYAVQSTLNTSDGQPITGLPRLAELLPADIVQCLVKWWHLGHSGPALTFGGQALDCVSTSTNSTWATPAWPELLEFESSDYVGHEQAYPLQALGPILGPAVQALTDRQQVPPALAAQSLLVSASTTVQPYFDVLIDNRRIPLSLWCVLIAAPGERKTSTDTIAFQQLALRQREAEQRYRVALDGWKAASADKSSDPGPKPRNPCWMLSEATSEGLTKTLNKHWPALALTNSDAGSWLAGYSMREGRDSATAAVLSQLWSGAAYINARASQDEPVALINRRLAMSLMLQPALAAQLFESNTLSGQGFLSRCLPAFPKSTIGSRFYKPLVQSDTRLQTYFDAQDTVLLQPPTMNLETGELSPHPLNLTTDAMQRWITVHDTYERAMADEHNNIQEVVNKAPEQVLRLAGVMAVIERNSEVKKQHIDNAALLVDFYIAEWQHMTRRLVAHRKDIEQPRQLLAWMQKRFQETGQDVFSLRDAYRTGPRLVRDQSGLARELMAELLRRGYVRPSGKDYQLRPRDVL